MCSVVIPTRNRSRWIPSAALFWSTLRARTLWELIIVDNGSTDDTMHVLGHLPKMEAKCVSVRVLRELGRGASRARNTGWRAALGDIVVFLDDDCYPQSDLIDRACAVLRDPNLQYAGGRLLLYDHRDWPITVQERTAQLLLEPYCIVSSGLLQSACLAVKTAALERVGGFDPYLGAGTQFFCEDLDLVNRLAFAGFRGVYDPALVTYHHHRRRATSEVKNLARAYDFGRGAFYAKCLFVEQMRLAVAKEWYWRCRGALHNITDPRSSLGVVLSEVRGAARYLWWYTGEKMSGRITASR